MDCANPLLNELSELGDVSFLATGSFAGKVFLHLVGDRGGKLAFL